MFHDFDCHPGPAHPGFPVHMNLPPCTWTPQRNRMTQEINRMTQEGIQEKKRKENILMRKRIKYWTDRNFRVGEPKEVARVLDVLDVAEALDCQDVLDHISKLPEELKLEILRKLSFDQLLDFNLPFDLLRLVLPIPPNVKFESWLAKLLIEKNKGYIFIPAGNSMFISNHDDLDCEDPFRPFEVSNISPGLEPGIYKLRILQGGFDLVKDGHNFISSQCGPLACYHEELEKNWAGSFIS